LSKIWIFNFTDPPPQISSDHSRRHEFLAHHLSSSGHDIHWILDSFSHSSKTHLKPSYEESNLDLGVTMIRSMGYKKNISIRRLFHNHFLSMSSLYIFIKKIINEGKPNKVLVSFPPMEVSFALVIICKLFGISIIVDYRDLHPDIFPIIATNKILKLIITLFIKPYSLMVGWSLRNATRVCTTSPDVSHYLFKKYSLKKLPLSFYHCFKAIPKKSSDLKLGPIAYMIMNYKKTFSNPRIFSYCGTLSKRLDLLNFIQVFKNIPDKSNILFICGSGDMLDTLKQESKGQRNIIIKEHLSREEVFQIYDISDYGILPYPEELDFQLAPPTKFAEILHHNLSIISSKSTFVHRHFSEEINAKFYKFGNYASLYSIIDGIIHQTNFVINDVNYNLYKQHFDISKLEKMVKEIQK